MDTIGLFVRLVLSGVSLRGVPRVMEVVSEAWGLSLDIPHWTTGRLWLLRVGQAMLTRPLEQADDWAWLADHSVQIGQEKFLAIVGLRLRDLPEPGTCLQHHDLQLIALVPRTSWTAGDVNQALAAAVERTGVPRVIVNDHGTDLHGGVQLFQQQHPRTVEIYDLKHKAACLWKRRLEKHPRWLEFQRQSGQTRCAVQQTELAFLAPLTPKTKARFRNLQPQWEWADGVLDVLREPPAKVLQWVSRERLPEKPGWLHGFADNVREWSQWQQVVNLAVGHVDRHGLSRTTAKELSRKLSGPWAHASTTTLVRELVDFVRSQGEQAKPGERFPGSTEVLESCFGKMKELEQQQSRGGFTSLVLAFGALLADTTSQFIKSALPQSATHHVSQWCRENLGTTLFAKRKLAFANGATTTE